MVKVFDFIVSDSGKNYKIKTGQKLEAVTAEQIEKKINKECTHIKSIIVTSYTAKHHNNGDYDEVHLIYTVECFNVM